MQRRSFAALQTGPCRQSTDFCDAFPDKSVPTDPYIDLFASGEDKKRCAVAQITGTMTGGLKMPDGVILKPNRRRFDVTFTAICRWRDGRIVEQRGYFDTELMLSPLRGEN